MIFGKKTIIFMIGPKMRKNGPYIYVHILYGSNKIIVKLYLSCSFSSDTLYQLPITNKFLLQCRTYINLN